MNCQRLFTRFLVVALAFSLSASANATLILVDFGDTTAETTSDGSITWNTATGPVAPDLRDTAGIKTEIDIQFTTNLAKNNPGGLTSPSPALLGDFAVASATSDYFYTQSSASFLLQDLNPASTYNIRLFGTRDTTGIRETLYTITGGSGSLSQILQTSGPGSSAGGGNGNDDTIITFNSVVADANNEILINYAVQSGGFAYLGVMGIEAVAVPEPSSFLLVGAICAGLHLARRWASAS